jgi:hypothetical protein
MQENWRFNKESPMKRDLELVREILLWMESLPEGSAANQEPEIPERTEEEIGFHAHLMEQAGLITAADIGGAFAMTPLAMPLSITWKGYEFLDASRDSGLWEKAKKNVIGPAAGVSFTVLLEWLKMEAKQRLGIDVTGSSS